jgi:hypothetical protein
MDFLYIQMTVQHGDEVLGGYLNREPTLGNSQDGSHD